jgi:3-oxoacyl-(acyl-carrier-protein) synthase
MQEHIPPDEQRIVVTGVGAVTPLGLDVESSWLALKASETGVVKTGETHLADHAGYEDMGVKVVAAVKDFSIPKDFKEKSVKVDKGYMHRSALLGVRAVHEALSQAGILDEFLSIDKDQVDPYEVSLYMGSTFAGMGYSAEAATRDRLRPSDLFRSLPARVSTSIAMQYGINGPSPMVGWECASGALALDASVRSLLPYRSDAPPDSRLVVAGGADAPIEPANLRYFEAIEAVSPSDNPHSASRPFDKNASGLIMGEGAGALVLETWASAQSRGLTEEDILAELVGHASFTHADSKTRAGIEGAVRAMTKAAHMGQIAVEETIYINAHATSTIDGDPIEARIVQEFVHRNGLKKSNVWMNSSKGAIGHTMGASGAIEAIFATKSVSEGIIPPALNLDTPIEQAAGLNLSSCQSTELGKIDMVLSNSLGFGGGVTTLAFRKFQP